MNFTQRRGSLTDDRRRGRSLDAAIIIAVISIAGLRGTLTDRLSRDCLAFPMGRQQHHH
eukprot:COSAG01_NODE_31616_length_594_cov_1.678788_1_plen_58_part_10